MEKLQGTGPDIVIPGIERVPSAANLKQSDLRYFWPDDKPEVEDLAKRLGALGTPVQVVYPEKLARSGRPRHYELWLAPD